MRYKEGEEERFGEGEVGFYVGSSGEVFLRV